MANVDSDAHSEFFSLTVITSQHNKRESRGDTFAKAVLLVVLGFGAKRGNHQFDPVYPYLWYRARLRRLDPIPQITEVFKTGKSFGEHGEKAKLAQRGKARFASFESHR